MYINKIKLKCCKCGNILETLPASAQDININKETGQIEYYCGQKYGYRTVNDIVCEVCQKKNN